MKNWLPLLFGNSAMVSFYAPGLSPLEFDGGPDLSQFAKKSVERRRNGSKPFIGSRATARDYSVPATGKPALRPAHYSKPPPNQPSICRKRATFRRSRQPIRPNNPSATAALDGSGTGTISPTAPLTNAAVPKEVMPASLKKRI